MSAVRTANLRRSKGEVRCNLRGRSTEGVISDAIRPLEEAFDSVLALLHRLDLI